LIFLIMFALFILIFISICYFCYLYAFKRDARRQSHEYDVPSSDYRNKVIGNILNLMQTPFQEAEIVSEDGLKLYGRYYHFKDGAPVVIMMHGYRSNAFRDSNGGFLIVKNYGLNILMPDQRAHGKSEGGTITFGVMESSDCLKWIDYVKKTRGKNTKIILMGLSMGAATVTMTADIAPEENVKGIIADCGFSSPKEILLDVSRQMKIPAKPAYFFLKISAKLFGHFDVEKKSSVEALKKTNIPVLFIHGEADTFVPCAMSRTCHEICVSDKKIFTVEKATHAVSYYLDTEGYTNAVTDFLNSVLK